MDAENASQTLADAAFYWREGDGLRLLVSKPLEDAGFANGFSTRLGGVSPFPENDLSLAGFSEDTAENIAENRRRFLRLFEGDPRLKMAWQVHGNDVEIVDEAALATDENRFDALVSDLDNVLIGVKTADCVPILIGDPKTKSFASVHAGWRGTVSSIAARSVERLVENYGAWPSDLICAIGPAAGCSNYEVGEDVITQFSENFENGADYFEATRPGHALVDLKRANRDQLISIGVPAENIYISELCTMERTDLFFSYRKEKKQYGKTGRLLSVIGRSS